MIEKAESQIQSYRAFLPAKHPESEVVSDAGGFKERLPAYLAGAAKGRKAIVITDLEADESYGGELGLALMERNVEVGTPVVVDTERPLKNIETWARRNQALVRPENEDASLILAFGGDNVADIARFVAANHPREVRLVYVPTTLSAQIDSAVGGRTTANPKHGAHAVALYKFPELTLFDPTLLESSSFSQMSNGLSVAVNYAVLDSRVMKFMEQRFPSVLAGNKKALNELIAHCVDFKRYVVDADSDEDNIRQGLRFGHTVGDALQEASKYKLSYGQAAALGMYSEALIALRKGVFKAEDVKKLKLLIEEAHLPTLIPSEIDREAVLKIMRNNADAVREEGDLNDSIRIVVPRRFGGLFTDGARTLMVTEEELRDSWSEETSLSEVSLRFHF